MKKIKYYILSILFVITYSCDTDLDAEEQGLLLQDFPNYVAFSLAGVGKTFTPVEVSEGNSNTGDDVNVEIPGGTLSDVTVNYTLSGTAVFGTDYTIDGATSSGGTVVIDFNNTPNIDGLPFNADIVVETLDNSIIDGDKTVIITLTSASNDEGDLLIGRAGQEELRTATVIITDDDE